MNKVRLGDYSYRASEARGGEGSGGGASTIISIHVLRKVSQLLDVEGKVWEKWTAAVLGNERTNECEKQRAFRITSNTTNCKPPGYWRSKGRGRERGNEVWSGGQ